MTEAGRDSLSHMADSKLKGGKLLVLALYAALSGCGVLERISPQPRSAQIGVAPATGSLDRQIGKRPAAETQAIPRPSPKPAAETRPEKAEKTEKTEKAEKIEKADRRDKLKRGEVAALPGAEAVRQRSVERLPRLDPKRLVGLDENELRRMLGDPEAVRDALPARVWNYRADNCSLDVFLYLDLASHNFRALTYDVRTTTKSRREDAIEVCVGRIYVEARD